MSKRIIWGISALVLTSAVALGAWWTMGRTSEGAKVRVATATPSAIHQEVYTTGTVNPIVRQEIRVLSPSKVAKVSVKVGETVSSGQILVQMDTTLADAQVAQAQASVDASQANLSAAMKAQAEASIPQAQAMLKQAQEGLKVAKAQRDQNKYTSGLKGTVLELHAREGNVASVQEPLVVIADLSTLRVDAELNEVDAGKVQIGQRVNISSKVLGETVISGAVSEIAPQAVSKVSVQGNTPPSVAVGVNLDNIPKELKPGFTVSLKILTASKEGVLAIPQEALFQETGKNYVFRVINQKLEKTEVSLGIVNETLQEIASGLQAGDRVVLNPTSQLTHGMSVQVDVGSGTL